MSLRPVVRINLWQPQTQWWTGDDRKRALMRRFYALERLFNYRRALPGDSEALSYYKCLRGLLK